MVTPNPRINITIPRKTAKILSNTAKQNNKSVSKMALELTIVNLFQVFIVLAVMLFTTTCEFIEPPYTFYFINESLVTIEIDSEYLNPSTLTINPENTGSAVSNLGKIDFKYSPASRVVIRDFDLPGENNNYGITIYFKDK